MKTIALVLLFVYQARAQTQTLRVFSELTRIGPDGQVVAADRGGEPRHILSPGLIRGAWASFRIVVQPPGPGPIILEVGQNPENAVKVVLYRESFEEHGIPDALTPAMLPYSGEITSEVKVMTFWLDLWVPRDALVDRIKIEPQLWFKNDWFSYPMEVRILTPVLPLNKTSISTVLPKVTDRADSAVLGPIRQALCKQREAPAPASTQVTARQLIRRNVLQHLQLARTSEKLRLALASAGAEGICTNPPPSSSEWYLKVRDYLYGREK